MYPWFGRTASRASLPISRRMPGCGSGLSQGEEPASVPDRTFRPVATSIPQPIFSVLSPFTCPVDSQWLNYNRFSRRNSTVSSCLLRRKVMNIVPEGKRSGGAPSEHRHACRAQAPRCAEISRQVLDGQAHRADEPGRVVVRPSSVHPPKRGRASAEKYQKIWTDEGSPFTIAHQKLEAGLGAAFEDEGLDVAVRCAMSYSDPSCSIACASSRVRAARVSSCFRCTRKAPTRPPARVRQRGARAQEGALGRAVRLRRQLPRRPHLHPRHRCVHRACRFQGGL